MDKKNCKTGKRTKRQVEKILMVIDVKREIIDIPVSYTHLRAHETDSYLVCRLLLEKKKTQNI